MDTRLEFDIAWRGHFCLSFRGESGIQWPGRSRSTHSRLTKCARGSSLRCWEEHGKIGRRITGIAPLIIPALPRADRIGQISAGMQSLPLVRFVEASEALLATSEKR